MASRDIHDLVTELQTLYYLFESKCKAANMEYIVTCTKRTVEEQKILVTQGKSWTVNSLHLVGRAFDIAVVKNGKISWNFADYAPYGVLGESIGLEWAGRWKKPKTEGPHFQLKGENK